MIAIGHSPRKYHAVIYINADYAIAEIYRRQFSLGLLHFYSDRFRDRYRRKDFDYGAHGYMLLGFSARNAYLNCIADRSALLKKDLSVEIKTLK